MGDIRKTIGFIEAALRDKSDSVRSREISMLLDNISTSENPILDRVIADNVAGIRSQLSNPPKMVMDYEIKRHLDNIKVKLDLLGQ